MRESRKTQQADYYTRSFVFENHRQFRKPSSVSKTSVGFEKNRFIFN